ncbi:MAG TPA: type I DNA topoisomerase [Bacteroidales bacterium]|nr:type I DNA topoisomerase [Bacteroidales bacterium]
MTKNLVIVESPAKAKTIGGFLGKDYTVRSCMGHVADLSKKDLGVDIADGFTPKYVISPEKKKVVAELTKLARESETVWLASDEDREGEAISWHLVEALNLEESRTRRIAFHEITKTAIQEAIESPRPIDRNLVNAQQARRVLDRLVGFELSPLLWKKIKPSLSAGRVQSVAVRLIVEREEEIKNFQSVSAYRIVADFLLKTDTRPVTVKAELNRRFNTKEEAVAFLKQCIAAQYGVEEVDTRPAKKSPAPPFTTSTLQQEASRKLGFSVANTMRVAQELYESGFITYMRTDSVNLSDMALAMARKEIGAAFGEEYVKTRKFSTRTKGAQEAHEAIRPTYLTNRTIEGDKSHKRLYELIWKRTIASQMADAELEKTTVTIGITGSADKFVARGEVVRFDGFLKVYMESSDEEEQNGEEGMLPPMSTGDRLDLQVMTAQQKFTQQPYRYTEAMLVKKLEELGIGRPSTYAPTISTIQKREYVVKEDRPGTMRNFTEITLKKGVITEEVKTEKVGYEKSKLFPTDIGTLVNSFLLKHFENIMDYNFTASVEEEFDEIAEGRLVWNSMISDFYWPFHKQIEETLESSGKVSGERHLGADPKTGLPVYVKIGRYGPMVQMGDSDADEKPKFASLNKGQSLETLTLEEALDLFKLPRTLGEFEDSPVVVATGRFGPYIRHHSQFYSLPKAVDPLAVDLPQAIEIMEAKRKADSQKILAEFNDGDRHIQVINGRFGAYITCNKENYKIPKSRDARSLTLEDVKKIMSETSPTKPKSKKKK